jgi:4-hydroxybenzoyl-CoA thioesterase
MSQIFKVEYPIRFSHCDPAGIVYFPRFFDLVHQAMEDWFTYGLGERFSDLVMQKGLGTPTVSTQCDFISPARFGDTLIIELSILRLGNASVEMLFQASVQGRECFKCRHTICLFDRTSVKAVPIPGDLRDRMQAYVAAAVS